MKEMVLSTLLRLIAPLRFEWKFAPLTRLLAEVQATYAQAGPDPEYLLETLAGAWKDMPDSLADDLMQARSLSQRAIDSGF